MEPDSLLGSIRLSVLYPLTIGLAHWLQNFESRGFSAPHFAHLGGDDGASWFAGAPLAAALATASNAMPHGPATRERSTLAPAALISSWCSAAYCAALST